MYVCGFILDAKGQCEVLLNCSPLYLLRQGARELTELGIHQSSLCSQPASLGSLSSPPNTIRLLCPSGMDVDSEDLNTSGSLGKCSTDRDICPVLLHALEWTLISKILYSSPKQALDTLNTEISTSVFQGPVHTGPYTFPFSQKLYLPL